MEKVVVIPRGMKVVERDMPDGYDAPHLENLYTADDLPRFINNISLPKEDFLIAVKAIALTNKITAIKIVRAACAAQGMGLKEAKEFVEALFAF